MDDEDGRGDRAWYIRCESQMSIGPAKPGETSEEKDSCLKRRK
jgi:hypothetical protein